MARLAARGAQREQYRISVLHRTAPLAVGQGEWAYNEIHLTDDPGAWANLHPTVPEDTLDAMLAHSGFIG